VEATGGVPAYSWSATGLPDGLAIDPASGQISGVPETAGTTTVTVTVNDSAADPGSASVGLDLAVAPSADPEVTPLTITTDSLPQARMEESYSAFVAATGGTKPYAWSATGLPGGLTIDEQTGEITGTPTDEGTFEPEITVRDSEENSDMRVLSIRVEGHGGHGGGGTEPIDGACTEDPCLVCLAIPDAPYYRPALFVRTSIINGEGMAKEEGPANTVDGTAWTADGKVPEAAPTEAWGNIVPPVVHPNGKGVYAGRNWTEIGQLTWQATCGGGDPLPPPDDNGGHQKLTFCIASGDRNTPYVAKSMGVQLIINGEGVAKRKNSPAKDPVVGVFPDEVWGNIIPPFTHTNKKATYAGLNWTAAGQAIHDADCTYTPPPPVPPPAPAPAPDAQPVIAPEPSIEPVVVAPALPAAVTEPIVQEITVVDDAPTVVAAPTTATLPMAVPAGEGSPTVPLLPILLVGLGLVGALAGLTGLAGSMRGHN
jgi:hypothetical protein